MRKALREALHSLSDCPRELWHIFALKALESYSYFSMSLIYVIYLTDTFGVSDLASGGSYGLWGMLQVLWGVVLGPAVDMLGIRKCLIICFVAECVCRIIMATTTSLPLLYLLLYTLLPMSGSLGVPVMTIAVKRYTSEQARSIAFGLFYTVMNVAALVNGLAVDALRKWLCHGISFAGITLGDGNRVVVASGAVSAAIALVITFYISPAVEEEALAHVGGVGCTADDAVENLGLVSAERSSGMHNRPTGNHTRVQSVEGSTSGSWILRTFSRVHNSLLSVHNNTVELLAYPGMWKYLVMALFLLNLRQTYRYMDSMLPKYMLRTMGCDAPYGTTYSINPAMIIVLVPIVSLVTSHVSHFDMVHYGSFVSASSPFWIYLVPSPPVLGPVLFVVQLSLGEAVWSPRWYDYTMDVAPEGREGLFGAIAAAPLFLAKLPTGLLSGLLLNSYCPLQDGGCSTSGGEVCPNSNGMVGRALLTQRTDAAQANAPSGQCDPWLWAVVGFITMTTPILITTFQSCLRPTRGDTGGYMPAHDANAVDGPSVQMHADSQDTFLNPEDAGLDTVVEGSQELGMSAASLLDHSRDGQYTSGRLPPTTSPGVSL